MEMNQYLFRTYYRGRDDKWRQPGVVDELPEDEGAELVRRGHAKLIETMALEQPETRVIKFRRGRNVSAKI